MPTAEALLALCESLDRAPSVSEQDASSFLAQFQLDTLLQIFSAGVLPADKVSFVQSILSKVLSTSTGRSALQHAQPYLDAALQSPQPPLRRLAAEQLSSTLQQHNPLHNMNEAQQHALMQLLHALQDEATAVSSCAERGVVQWAASSPALTSALLAPNTPWGMRVRELSGSRSASVRLRVLGLLVELGRAGGAQVALQLQASGLLLDLLGRELGDTSDPLSALAALNLVSELVEHSPPGMTGTLCAAVT
eukprot:CAMPEP_0202909038 /NCGR_PEP_ID=MMETSP1392-20130828/48074_1 /ASSEMBLY_ACC=CAM_ASM_000868 /TAXON_ID=225041 /ORGANISM="Chlamydomonas chlamydogama, Strain SAG 11-48b" /LENGTH=249 /DNA_ID=CAMNT_0049598639 /DNA_START=1 /DNA_END=746 /DNA_ORIENTATION=+